MLWIILIILSLVLIGIRVEKTKDEDDPGIIFGIVMAIISLILFLGFLFDGSSDYNYLVNKKNEVEAFVALYPDIKNVKGIKMDGEKMKIINADFVMEFSKQLGCYNGYLEKCQRILSNKKFWWFRESMFMSKKILDMKKISVK